MRVPTNKIPAQPLTQMWERHYEMMRRLVAGEKPISIAQSMGITAGRFSIIMNSPLFQSHLQELRERANANAADIQGRLSKLAINSMDILEQAIRAKSGDVGYVDLKPIERIKTAQDVLDRAGHGAVQKSLALTGVLTSKDIDELKQRKMKIIDQDSRAGVAVGLPLVSP